ncbi:MAG: inositol monophosphatase [Hyphomicrobiales bacterium]|nr:inositol monophosphatase [Hyphomicrobiales bacterium]PCJ92346.1 MAG: inositol monophosphatase [Hyphomicrobiales bacterium]
MARSALLNVMVQAATKAGRNLTRDFNEIEQLQVSIKGPGDFVTSADLRAEEIIQESLTIARPDWGFLMEESGEVKGSDPFHRWIVDPLNGTTNFLHSLPFFAVSIALERQGQVVAGVVYNPITEELFTAEKGGGAFMNDRRMRVAARKNLSDSALATGIPHYGKPNLSRYIEEASLASAHAGAVRGFGCAALSLAYVGAGRLDGYWEHGLSPWDMAAGIVLIREAGGFICDIGGGERVFETGGIIAGNETIRNAVRDKIVRNK